jgi:four helix bundle protein
MENINSQSYKKLIVWKEAKNLVLKIYQITKKFPREENYILTSQMKRSSISVLSNIAEGNQRKGQKDKIHFLNMSQSSLIELDCQIDLANELGFISDYSYEETIVLLNKVGYLLHRFILSKENPFDHSNPSYPSNPK